MAKIETLNDIGSLANTTSARAEINGNFEKVSDAIQNTLSRDGSQPNEMEADLDLNSHYLLNVADPVNDGDGVNLRSVRGLVEEFTSDIIVNAVLGSTVVVSGLATAGQSTIDLPSSPGTLYNAEVYINGLSLTPSDDFTLAGAGANTIVLSTPLALNDEFLVRYHAALASGLPDDPALRPDLASVAVGKGSALVAYKAEGTGAITRDVEKELDDLYVNVKRFGATGDGVTDDSVAINAAITHVGSNGGGTVYFPKGTYLVQDHTGDAGADKAFCIGVQYNNVHLLGAGRTATYIKQMDGALRAHVIKVGRRVGVPNPVSHISIRSMTIDGNRLNISESNGDVIDVSSGCSNVLIEDLHIKQAGWYGIGMQRDNFKNCRIRNVLIEDTGGDGIDWKVDTNSTSYGNYIENVTVLRHGLAALPGVPQAGIDVRQGVSVRNCYVGEYTGEAAGFRVSLGVNDLITTVPLQRSVLENITAIASAVGTGTTGFQPGVNGVKVSGAHFAGNTWNVRVRSSLNLFENVSTAGGAYGIYVLGDANGLPTNNTFSNVLVRSATLGGIVLVDDGTNHPSNNSFINAIAAANASDAANATIAAGITGTRFIGGSIAAGFVDLGTDTVTSGVQGLITGLKAGRNLTQYVSTEGDSFANKVIGVSVSGSPKTMNIVADANSGDLRLQALGASAYIRFGTHTANADAPITGYIQIRDDAGNFRKLATIT